MESYCTVPEFGKKEVRHPFSDVFACAHPSGQCTKSLQFVACRSGTVHQHRKRPCLSQRMRKLHKVVAAHYIPQGVNHPNPGITCDILTCDILTSFTARTSRSRTLRVRECVVHRILLLLFRMTPLAPRCLDFTFASNAAGSQQGND